MSWFQRITSIWERKRKGVNYVAILGYVLRKYRGSDGRNMHEGPSDICDPHDIFLFLDYRVYSLGLW